MDSLISFDGAADVMNNLINKLSDAIGWIATRDTPNRMAVDTYIQEIKDSNLNPATKAALISNARKTIREHRNQSEVLKIALQSLSPSATPEQVDDDWLAQFMDKARLVSDEKFRILWGNILAEECNHPDSIPKALLHIMEQMDKNMAEAFMNVAALSVWYEYEGDKFYTPIIKGSNIEEYYRKQGVNYGDLVELQSVGLIKMEFGFMECSFTQSVTEFPVVVHYHDQEYAINGSNDGIPCGNVVYTNAGGALCKTISALKIDDFFEEHCIPFWEEMCQKSVNAK